MAAPNIVDVATITGKTAVVALSDTSMTAVVSNTASSGKVFKINQLRVTNVDGSNSATINVDFFSQDDIGGTGYALASTIEVPADTALDVITKNNQIYLEEDKSIGAQASAGNDLEIVCSYEEISE